MNLDCCRRDLGEGFDSFAGGRPRIRFKEILRFTLPHRDPEAIIEGFIPIYLARNELTFTGHAGRLQSGRVTLID
jgi:hypothetical protein